MRFILTIGFTCFILSSNLFACFCLPDSFCEYLEEISNDPTSVVFKGSVIQSDSISIGMTAVEFLVEEIYQGEIVTPSSPYYDGETHINTDSTVWILTGVDAACHQYLTGVRGLLAVSYNDGFLNIGFKFGYVPTICKSDYFEITAEDSLTGFMTSNSFETMHLDDVESLMDAGCDAITKVETLIQEKTTIFPQPTSSMIHIRMDDNIHDWEISLMDLQGNRLLDINSSSVDLTDLVPSIYFLRFRKGSEVFSKKVVKI